MLISEAQYPSESPNESDSTDSPKAESLLDEPFQYCILFAYSVIVTVSIVSNTFIIVVILTNKQLRKGCNLLVLNLCLADVVYCISGVALKPIVTVLRFISLRDRAACITVQMLATASVVVISITTMAIAIDRYLCMRLTARGRHMKRSSALIINAIIWTLVIALCLPIGIHIDITVVQGEQRCMEIWGSNYYVLQNIHIAVLLIVQFVLPTTVVTACYVCTNIKFLCKSPASVHVPRIIVTGPTQAVGISQAKKNMLKVSILIIVCFVIAFMPSTILDLLVQYNFDAISGCYVCVLLVGNLIASTSTIANPILYGCMNTSFRRCLKRSTVLARIFSATHDQTHAHVYDTVHTHAVHNSAPVLETAV